MNARPRNVNSLREELLAKEKELSSVQEFLLEQDDDLRSCLHRVGDLELTLLANRPDSCATNTDCGETLPPPREIASLRHEVASGDARAATAVAVQGSTSSAGNSNNSSNSGCMASRETPISGMYLPSSSPGAVPPASPPHSPDDHDSSRRRTFAESSVCCAAVGNGPDAPVTPPNRNHERERRRRYHRACDGVSNPPDVHHRLANAAGAAEPTPSVVAPEPRCAPAAPTTPPSRPAGAAAAASCAPSPSSDGRRSRMSPCRTSTRRAERGNIGVGGGGEERGGGGGEISVAATVEVVSSPRVGSHRLADRPIQKQGRRRPEGDASCFATELADCDARFTHAERRAEAAEAAERSAAASVVTAMREARAAKDEAERLRLEGLGLSRWKEAVLDLRDMLRIAERDGGGGRGDGGDRREDDPVARHAKWVSSPALGTLLPHLQEGARDLLSDLVAARARIPVSSAAATAPSPAPAPAPTRPSSSGTRIASIDRGCTCEPTAAERWSRGEARSSEARSRTQSFDLQSRRGGQQQCAVCADASNNAECSRASRCGGGGGETGGAAVATAAVGLGVGDGVGDKSAASLEKECETLRIVVQALRKKEEDSQRRIVTLEERMLQASLAAVERDALVSVLRRKLALRDDSYASDAAEEGSGGRGRSRSRTRGRTGCRGSVGAVSTPEQDVARSGRLSRVFRGGVAVELSPPPSTRLPRSGCSAASVVGDGPDPSRCHRLSSSMLRAEIQPDQSPGRQACAASSLISGCRRQADACCCSRPVHAQVDPRRDDSRHPCNGNCEKGQTVPEVSSFGQAPPAPNAALGFTETPPMVALRGGYRDCRGGGSGTGCGAENASREIITPRTAKEEKRPGDPQAHTPTTDVIRQLLYESTPTSQMEPSGSAGRIALNGRRLFSEEVSTTAFPGGSGHADGVRGGTTAAAAALFSDPPCRRGCGSGGGPGERSGSRGMGARCGRNSDGKATAVLAADANSTGVVTGCSVGTGTAMAGGRIAKGEIVLRERLLQARRDFSALRSGVPADELML